MAKLSAATRHALSVVAHVGMAADLSKRVKGLEGFRDHYLKTLSPEDRAIWRRFEALVKQAYKDGAALLEQDMKDGS